MLVKHSSSVLILSSFSFLSFSYSSNLFEIKSIASVSYTKCFSPLICPSFSSFWKIYVICLSIFLIQLNKMLTQSSDFKLSVNTLSGISLALLVFRLPSFNFLLLSSWFELSLRSCFFEFQSNYSVISVSLMIIPTYSNCLIENSIKNFQIENVQNYISTWLKYVCLLCFHHGKKKNKYVHNFFFGWGGGRGGWGLFFWCVSCSYEVGRF